MKHISTQSELETMREQQQSLQTKCSEAEKEKNNLTRELSEKVS